MWFPESKIFHDSLLPALASTNSTIWNSRVFTKLSQSSFPCLSLPLALTHSHVVLSGGRTIPKIPFPSVCFSTGWVLSLGYPHETCGLTSSCKDIRAPPHKAFLSFSPNWPRPWTWSNGNPATFKQCLTTGAQGGGREKMRVSIHIHIYYKCCWYKEYKA